MSDDFAIYGFERRRGPVFPAAGGGGPPILITLTSPDDWTNAAWVRSGTGNGNATYGSQQAPDNSYTASFLSCNTTGTLRWRQQIAVSLIGGQQYTLNGYVGGVSAPAWCMMYVEDIASDDAWGMSLEVYGAATLGTPFGGGIATLNAHSANYEGYHSGAWCSFSMTGTFSSTVTARVACDFGSADNVRGATAGDNRMAWHWGA